MKCLLVDDSESMLAVMQHHLQQSELESLEIMTASSGKEAISQYQAHKPDVMLLDYVMPDMTGLEVLKALHGGSLNPLPVVMVTSFNDVEAVVDAIRHGAQNYLLKDRLSPGSLSLAVQDALQKYRMQMDLRFQTQEVERFTRTVAHDLKDQISGVHGVLNFLLENADSLDDTQQKMVQSGCESSKKMYEFVSDLLSYALAGNREQSFEPISLQEALEDAKRNLAEQIDTIGAHIHQDQALPVLTGSKRLMMQVFQNLLSNAMKYRSALTPEIMIEVQESENEWLISVADNGKGIGKEHLDTVFNAFERADGTKSIEGIGVGLATCRRIIEDIHLGRIWVESGEAAGSRFSFTLPKNLEEKIQAAA